MRRSGDCGVNGRFGAFSLRAVERILAAQAQPKTPLEALGDGQQEHLRKILAL